MGRWGCLMSRVGLALHTEASQVGDAKGGGLIGLTRRK